MAYKTDLLSVEAREFDRYLSKALILANAGGVIATLTFIGARLSSAPSEGYGIGIFVVLVLFFLGLCSAYLSIFCDFIRLVTLGADVPLDPKSPKRNKHIAALVEHGDIFLNLGVILFVIASGFALGYLFVLS